jgi:hypothetical protein
VDLVEDAHGQLLLLFLRKRGRLFDRLFEQLVHVSSVPRWPVTRKNSRLRVEAIDRSDKFPGISLL